LPAPLSGPSSEPTFLGARGTARPATTHPHPQTDRPPPGGPAPDFADCSPNHRCPRPAVNGNVPLMLGNVPLRAGRPLRGRLAGPLMVLPCGVLLLVFAYWPVVRGVVLSLYDTDLLGDPTRFVGLAHYADLFTDPDLRRALLATAAIAGLGVL